MEFSILLLVNCRRVPSIQGGIIHSWCELTQHSSNRHAVDQFRSVGEQGWLSGESTRLPPMWSGFKSRHRRHLCVEFFVGSLPSSKRFFSRYSGFLLSFKFQFDQESGRWRTTLWMCYLQIIIYLFIYLFIHSKLFIFCFRLCVVLFTKQGHQAKEKLVLRLLAKDKMYQRDHRVQFLYLYEDVQKEVIQELNEGLKDDRCTDNSTAAKVNVLFSFSYAGWSWITFTNHD